MIPILYDAVTEGSVPASFGVGNLTDCISASVTEERNGSYELELVYPVNGIHADEIQPNRFIKVKPNFTDNPQLFRIYKVSKALNGTFVVNAQHISYDLGGKVATSGSANTCVDACILLTNNFAGNFVITTDKVVSNYFNISEPSSVRSWFGGKKGSLLDVYGEGEWHYDNFTATLKLHRGADRSVEIRYGKNLTELSQELNIESLVTAIIPYAINPETKLPAIGNKQQTGLVLDTPREIAMNFGDYVDWEESTPITTQLDAACQNYITRNSSALLNLKNNIKLSFVQLSSLQERVDLCDTVHIYFEALGISAALKCISTTWDVLEDRYISTTFGDAKQSIADTIVQVQDSIKELPTATDVTNISTVIADHATELITGNLGGYVLIHDSNGDGEPDEILIMNTDDISTATKVWRWNSAGLGYSSTGYAGPYGLAMTADGEIVADFITTGVLNADLIKAGVISDVLGNSEINLATGVASLLNMNAVYGFHLLDEGKTETRATFKANLRNTELSMAAQDATNPFIDLKATLLSGQDTDSAIVTLKHLGSTLNAILMATTTGGKFTLHDPNEVKTVDLSNIPLTSGYGGRLATYNSNGNATFFGGCANNGNGSMTVYDASQAQKVRNNVNAYGRGEVNLWDENGINRVTIYGDGGLVLKDAGGNTCIDLDGSNKKIIADKMSVYELTNATINCSGVWGTIDDFWVYRMGNVVYMKLILLGNGSSVSGGSNGCTGTLSGIDLPLIDTKLVEYYQNNMIIMTLKTDGTFVVRNIGSALAVAVGGKIELSGSFIVA